MHVISSAFWISLWTEVCRLQNDRCFYNWLARNVACSSELVAFSTTFSEPISISKENTRNGRGTIQTCAIFITGRGGKHGIRITMSLRSWSRWQICASTSTSRAIPISCGCRSASTEWCWCSWCWRLGGWSWSSGRSHWGDCTSTIGTPRASTGAFAI